MFTIPIPLSYGSQFEGERLRSDDIYLECGGNQSLMVELCVNRSVNALEDGKTVLNGPTLLDVQAGAVLPLAILVEIAGVHFRTEHTAVIERQIHRLLNYTQGIAYAGQRDNARLVISKTAVAKGFQLHHLGIILHSALKHEYATLIDRLQVTISTVAEDVEHIGTQARSIYQERDRRIDKMKDESTAVFYSCTMCQSTSPGHVCIVTPEKSGMCGALNWLDCQVYSQINPIGYCQPVQKGLTLDSISGQWQGVNARIAQATACKTNSFNAYSITKTPPTSCNQAECIAAVLPLCNGIMCVNREYQGITPSGMNFSRLIELLGGGVSAPGFCGHSKYNIHQGKFISAEGGIKRLVWLPQILKNSIRERFIARAADIGIPDLLERIADEKVGNTEEEILPFLAAKNHPALEMESLV
ncbi:MAG: hypothetical protein FWH42_01585 [Dehalococcoidia bacterium]|nr:hypothetical protein [Dehalococcoidia bacterium]